MVATVLACLAIVLHGFGPLARGAPAGPPRDRVALSLDICGGTGSPDDAPDGSSIPADHSGAGGACALCGCWSGSAPLPSAAAILAVPHAVVDLGRGAAWRPPPWAAAPRATPPARAPPVLI